SFKDKVQVIRPLPGREKPVAPLYPWQHFNTVFQPMPMRFAQRGAMRLPICPEGVDGRMVDMGRFGHGTTYGLHQISPIDWSKANCGTDSRPSVTKPPIYVTNPVRHANQ